MPAYWWKCDKCNESFEFKNVTTYPGIAHFIRDELIPSDWDQGGLENSCPNCDMGKIRITYDFPGKDKETLRIIHIVGLFRQEMAYLPMMWETSPAPYNVPNWFDFKYIIGRSVYGLNKPAVFEQEQLKALFRLYCEKTGNEEFP